MDKMSLLNKIAVRKEDIDEGKYYRSSFDIRKNNPFTFEKLRLQEGIRKMVDVPYFKSPIGAATIGLGVGGGLGALLGAILSKGRRGRGAAIGGYLGGSYGLLGGYGIGAHNLSKATGGRHRAWRDTTRGDLLLEVAKKDPRVAADLHRMAPVWWKPMFVPKKK